MKKFMVVAGLLLAGSFAYAACVGPYCYDDTGASINGSVMDGNGAGMPVLTLAVINAASPRFKGQEVFCSDCGTFNTNKGGICISTGTSAGAYAQVSSATAVTNCK